MDGLVCLVTGANKGIGFEIARKLSEHILFQLDGAGVCILGSRDLARGKDAMAMLTKDGFEKVVDLVQLDVEDEMSVKKASEELKAKYPKGLSVVVNNAGFAFKQADDSPASVQFPATFKPNYYGVKNCMKHFLPIMKDNGRVVTVSSMAGQNSFNKTSAALQEKFRAISSVEGLDRWMNELEAAAVKGDDVESLGFAGSAYGNSKLAVTKLTQLLGKKSVQKEFGCTAENVLINCCCPGWCKTDMAGLDKPPKTAAQGAITPVRLALIAPEQTQPQGEYWTEETPADYL